MSDQILGNPLLAKLKLPGKVFVLPSSGKFYTNKELVETVENGDVHVKPLSAFDEINLKNPDLLFSGKSIVEVVKTCVPDIQKPTELFSKDVDALMIFMRLVTYGPNYDIKVTHTCKGAKEHAYTMNIEEIVQDMKVLDEKDFENYNVTLPNGQVVQFQPVRYKHVIELLQKNESKKEFNAEDIKENLIISVLSVIYSVDGIEDRQLIAEWIRSLPTTFVTIISKKIDEINDWGPNLVRKATCRDCGEEFEVDVPINPITFFTE